MAGIKKNKQVPSLYVFPLDENTLDYILESGEIKNYVYQNTYECISDAVSKKRKSAQIFRLNNSDFYLEIPNTQWVNAINSCINHYEKKEEFETCAILTTLRSKINNN